MRINWRTVAAAAAVGFVISVLSGLLGGVGLGTALVRAATGSIVVGAAAGGIELVLRRHLPELFSEAPAGETGSTGERPSVEIVLEEDEYRPEREPEAGEWDGEDGEAERGGFAAAAGGGGEPALQSASLEESLVEEVTEELGGEEPVSLSEDDPQLFADRREPADAEETGLISELEDDSEAEDLDSLPDIEAFSTGFTDDSAEDGPKQPPASADSGDVGMHEQDPAVMAKALQTMLKRDERGK